MSNVILARAGMVADFIQPGLIQLQPNLEDFMDTLEPLQGTHIVQIGANVFCLDSLCLMFRKYRNAKIGVASFDSLKIGDYTRQFSSIKNIQFAPHHCKTF